MSNDPVRDFLDSGLSDQEIREKLLSTTGSSTVFIVDSNNDQVDDGKPSDYSWFGPVPRVGEIIHVTKHSFRGEGGYHRKLKVTEVSWSAHEREKPALPGTLFISCEIMAIEEK